MQRVFHGVWILTGALAVASVAVPVRAAEPQAARESDVSNDARVSALNEAGAKHYEKRNYRLAIESFIEAYAIDHDPNLLFNIARCYEELGETAAAIEKYTTFVESPGADAEGRVRAEASLRALKHLSADAAPAGRGRESAEPKRDQGESEPETEQHRGISPLWKWSTLGGGVVLTGVGATLYVLGARDHSQVTSAPGYGDPSSVYPMTRDEAQSLVDSGDTKKLIGGIGMGLGSALVATSVVLFLTGGSTEESNVALSILPTSRDVTASLSGRF